MEAPQAMSAVDILAKSDITFAGVASNRIEISYLDPQLSTIYYMTASFSDSMGEKKWYVSCRRGHMDGSQGEEMLPPDWRQSQDAAVAAIRKMAAWLALHLNDVHRRRWQEQSKQVELDSYFAQHLDDVSQMIEVLKEEESDE